MNKVAPKSKGPLNFDQKKMNRDRSLDGLIGGNPLALNGQPMSDSHMH